MKTPAQASLEAALLRRRRRRKLRLQRLVQVAQRRSAQRLVEVVEAQPAALAFAEGETSEEA